MKISDRQQQIVETPDDGALRQIITTPHGEVRIARIPDGRYALGNDRSEPLIELVKNACKGKAQGTRFRNWLISPHKLPEILAAITGKQRM